MPDDLEWYKADQWLFVDMGGEKRMEALKRL